jgi:hypothetical protein
MMPGVHAFRTAAKDQPTPAVAMLLPPRTRSRRRAISAPLVLLLGLAIAALLASGCSEWRKYWKKTPLRPETSTDATAPLVSLRSPSGPDLAHPTPVTGESSKVVIEAQDDGGVARVALYCDSTAAVDVPGPPWEYRWDTTTLAEASIHRLWAAAFDAAGNRGLSDTAYAQVFNAGPQVQISEPAAGARVLGSIPVSAQFPGPVPEIVSVEFLSDAQPVGSLTAPPWTITLDTHALAPGDHYLTARATTALGGVGVSPAVLVRVNNGVPVVTIDFPDEGHEIAPRGTLVLSGSASDVVEGPIPDARFSWRSHVDGLIGTGRYLRVRNLSVGRHMISATAVNAWGTEQTAAVQIEVLAQATYTYCRDIHTGIFRFWCLVCHVPGTTDFPTSQLDLSSYSGLMAGGVTQTYESIVPCRPESSLVWNKVTEDIPWVGDPMPPRDQFLPLPAAVRARLQTWILQGAPPDDPEPCE